MEEDLWPEASLIFELLEGDEPLAPGALVALEEGLGGAPGAPEAQGPLPRTVVRALGELTDALAVPSSRALGQAALTLRCLCAWADCALEAPEALASAAALVLAPRARQALAHEPPSADSPSPHRRPRSPLRRLSLRIALRAAISPRPLRPWGFPQLPRCFSRPLPPQCRRLGWPPRAPWRRPRGRVLDALARAPGWPFGAGPGVSEQAPWRLAIA